MKKKKYSVEFLRKGQQVSGFISRHLSREHNDLDGRSRDLAYDHVLEFNNAIQRLLKFAIFQGNSEAAIARDSSP